MKYSKIAFVVLIVVLTTAGMSNASGVAWGYEGDGGPEHWSDLNEQFFLCNNGTTQSPINIQAVDIHVFDREDIVYDYETSELIIFNNGHTVEVEYDPGSFVVIDDAPYELLQLHFHAPSEHTISGHQFAMELHLVHLCGRCLLTSEIGALAVVGVLIEEGEENEAFAKFWDTLPTEVGEEFEHAIEIDINEILPADRTAYVYEGSLTTPPCSEGVKWNVLTTVIEMSKEQIDAFKSVLAETCCPFNNRPVQPLNDRIIELDAAIVN